MSAITIENVGELRSFLTPFTDECKICTICVEYEMYNGEGFIRIKRRNSQEDGPEPAEKEGEDGPEPAEKEGYVCPNCSPLRWQTVTYWERCDSCGVDVSAPNGDKT